MLSEFSDFFRTPYVDQHAKEVPKNIVFWGAPFHWHVKAFKDTVYYMHLPTGIRARVNVFPDMIEKNRIPKKGLYVLAPLFPTVSLEALTCQ